MKRYLVLAALLTTTLSWSQTVDELDNKGGFKEFKVGDDLSVHQDKIKFMKTGENADTKLYLVKERISVRTYTGEVELEFYKGKVQEVIVSFKNQIAPDFEDILKSLETLYGPAERTKPKTTEEERFEKLYTWTGKKVTLKVGFDENYKLTEMVYTGHEHELEKLKSEF